MGNLYAKGGVRFDTIMPGGFRLLSAWDQVAAKLNIDLVITSGTDGAHSGPLDPHHEGKAYDVRSHDFTDEQKDRILAEVRTILGPQFYVFLESPGTDNEHFHGQTVKGSTYPPV